MAILITGCSSGIGLSTALFLQNHGFDVIASARSAAAVAALNAKNLKAILLDVDSDESIVTAFNESLALANNHKIDVLINNAAFAQAGALEDLSREALRQQFETNVFGLQSLTNLAVRHMRGNNQGKIIHIGSILGLVGMPFSGAYNASKYALEGLADTLRLELRDTPIQVILIEPGPIKSKFRENCLTRSASQLVPNNSHYSSQYKKKVKDLNNEKKDPFMKPSTTVAKKILKIIKTKNPKPRYKVTLPAHLIAFLKRLLSSRYLDKVLARVF